jgi:hypothetical protein
VTQADLQAAVPFGVIEVMNRSGQVLQRIPFSGQSLRIGRAYDNDIIVSDPYVCPHHLMLQKQAGQLLATDLDSVNGTYSGRNRDRIKEVAIEDGALVHFGHSQLRFRVAGAEVAPSWLDTARHGFLAWFDKPWMPVLTVFLALLMLTLDNLLDSPEKLGPGVLASQLLYPIIGVLSWAGFWALLNRVISHSASFHIHLAIACAGITGLILVSEFLSLLGFAFGLDSATPWLKLLGRITVLSLVLYAHLRYATNGRNWLQAVVAVISGTLLFGTPAVGDIIEQSKFSSLPSLNPLLKPPAFQLRKGVSVEAFFAEAEKLREKADQSTAD